METVKRHEKEVGATTEGKVVVDQLLDAQLVALGSLQDWSKWLVGINAGVLGLLVFAAQRIEHPAPKGITYLICAIISFCASLTIATWLVGAVPAFIMRLKAHDAWSKKIWWIDWREKNIYGFKYGCIPLQVYAVLQHLAFVAGVILLTVSLSLALGAGRQSPNTAAPVDQKAPNLGDRRYAFMD
ncbi:MAG: hypothetical protein WAM82_28775 [Thermoanaerobaculia bacterium]